jgi:hypothetical protein
LPSAASLLTVARRLRPDLDDMALLEVYRFQSALRNRAALTRERGTSS